MYKSFQVKHFRNLRNLEIAGLKAINLITGLNDTGKTNLLEALFIQSGLYKVDLTLRVNAFRGIETFHYETVQSSDTPWDSLFYDFDTSRDIELSSRDQQRRTRKLHLRVIRDPEELSKLSATVSASPSSNKSEAYPAEAAQAIELTYTEDSQLRNYYMVVSGAGFLSFPVISPLPFQTYFLQSRSRVPVQEDARRFSDIKGDRSQVLDALRVVEPRLENVEVLIFQSVPMVHGTIQGKSIPLVLMGDGLARIASIILAISNARDGVVLIDEVENGLHHSVMPDVWRTIAEASQSFRTQVFATTHSFECIAAAHDTFSKREDYSFQLYRLERINGDIKVVRYDRASLDAAIKIGLEVR